MAKFEYSKKAQYVQAVQVGDGMSMDAPTWFVEKLLSGDISRVLKDKLNVEVSVGGRVVADKGDFIVHDNDGNLSVYTSEGFNKQFEKLTEKASG